MRAKAPVLLRSLSALVVIAFAGLAHAQQVSQPAVIPTGNWPAAVYSADVNEDGKPDLIYIDAGATPYASTTHILLNNGDGTFRAGATLATAGTALAIGHFDSVPSDFDPSTTRDLHVDIGWVVVSGNNSTSLTAGFAYGKGDGTFLGPFVGHITLGEPNIPQVVSVIAAPVRSGGADLLFAVDAANPLGIDAFYFNSFYQTRPGPNGGGTLQVVDINRDGVSDLVVTPYGKTVDIFVSFPGNRAAYSSSASPGPFYSSLLADIDGDTIPDLVVEGANGALSYFPGTSAGFSATAIPLTGAQDGTTGNGGHLIAIADLNGDHIPDIITSTPAGISVLLGQSATTPSYKLLGIYNAGPGRSSYALADFNSDGHLDLAVDSPEGIAILYGNADGSFQTSRSYAAGQPAYSLALGRFTSKTIPVTGFVDAAVATGIPQFQILSGDDKGGFSITTPPWPAGAPQTNGTRTQWSSAVQSYLDSDNILDLAVTKNGKPSTDTAGITLFYGNGDRTFTAPVVADPTGSSHIGPSSIATFNTDGVVHVLNFDTNVCGSFSIASRSTTIPAPPFIANSTSSPYNLVVPGYLTLGINYVSKEDIVCELNGALYVYKNNGSGSFLAPTILPAPAGVAIPDSTGNLPATGLFPSALLFADLDGDGFGDLIAIYHNLASDPAHPTAATPNQINIYFGDSSGSFTTPPISLIEPRNYYQATLADLNGDGKQELILSDGYLLAVRPWDGATRQFGAEQHYLAGMGINGIASYPVNAHNVLVTANGGAVITNPAINRGTLAANAEVNTGGITVLLPATTPLDILLPTETDMTNIVTPIFYGDIIGNVAVGHASPVDPADTQPLDGGTLAFFIDGVSVCVLPYISGQTQTCPATTGAGYHPGTYTLSAMYSGNAYYSSSRSPDYTVVILAANTQGTLTSSLNPAPVNQPVTFTATFTAPLTTPTGQVTFFDGAISIGTATLTPAGIATLTTSTLAVGTHPITATLAASLDFNPSTTTVLQQVITAQVIPPVPTTTTLTSSINPSNVGQSVTFTASLSAGAVVGQATPAGSITFTVDGVFLSTVTLNSQGIATISSNSLAAGSHIIAASYSGSPTGSTPAYLSSAGTLVQQVNAIVAGSFTLTVTPTTLSVPIGNSAVALATITALNGFNQPVTLSCSNLPRGVTCAFTLTTIPAGGGSTQLAVSATAPHDCNNTTPYFVSSGSSSWLGLLASSGLILLLRRRRKLITAITLTLALCILPATIGCGNCTDLGVYPGNYSFTVTATSTTPTAATATQTIQMTAHL